ncbi:MAG: tetratricopeptide repeat protein [Actinomycetota bacterium]
MVSEPDEGRASDLIRRACELTELADYATAAETAVLAIELEPNNALAQTIHAWALENLGEQHLDDARAIYEAAISLDATASWPRTALADLHHRAGRKVVAERLYRDVAEEVSESLGDRPRSLEFRGWSLYRLGRLDEAIQSFHASLERVPGRISVLFDLALSLLANGQQEAASEAYAAAVEAVRAADVRRRRAPLTVAAEDLEEAISSHPRTAELSGTTAIRQLLRGELIALGPSGTPSSDRPDGTI